MHAISADRSQKPSRWYLVQTKPAGESTAEKNLLRQGYEVYLPRLLQLTRRGGILREKVVALFPRYLFVRLREGRQALSPVRSSVGVTNVVRFGAEYAVVPEVVIRDLQARADPRSGLHRLAPPPALRPGTSVRIESGPLSGMQGLFEREAGEDRVMILLNLLGQCARVLVSMHSITPAAAGERGCAL